ncbi:hypothetical protein CASFOL_017589 [Castilleja foliolosa]|uniref:F-box domain-containing protein n=1 Tax=Castilleja foliolosa TaxID=1961234 RepID=A0ABD3D7D4_9LAMI
MLPTLPFDVITIILLMLPAKALVKFQCVCTSFRDLIRDQTFIKKHLHLSSSKGYLLHKSLQHNGHRTLNLLCDKTFDQTLEIELPLDLTTVSFITIGSFNGLLCLAVAYCFGALIYICNPLIRKYRTINFPITSIGYSFGHSGFSITLGFGYHDETNDYKIVRIVSSPVEQDVVNNYIDSENPNITTKIEVYSLMDDLWKEIEPDYFPWDMFDARSDIVVNETIHWKATYLDTTGDVMVILAFHLGDEVFRELSLPNYSSDGEDLVEYIGVYKGNLSLFVFHLNRVPLDEKCHLWVMKEYGVESSWMKVHSVVINPRVVSPLTFTRNNEIVYEDGDDESVVYDFDTKTSRVVIGREEKVVQDLVTYVESLVMIDG